MDAMHGEEGVRSNVHHKGTFFLEGDFFFRRKKNFWAAKKKVHVLFLVFDFELSIGFLVLEFFET